MRSVRVGAFNLNNLLSRSNFAAELPEGRVSIEATTTFTFTDPQQVRLREYEGRQRGGLAAAARGRLSSRPS